MQILPSYPLFFDLNIPAELTYNKRPDWIFKVKVSIISQHADGSYGIICELVGVTIWMISGITNWVKLNHIIESIANKKVEELLQPKQSLSTVEISEMYHSLTA